MDSGLYGVDLGIGVLAAALMGATFGLLHSGFTVYLGASQHVTGIGITLCIINWVLCFSFVIAEFHNPAKD